MAEPIERRMLAGFAFAAVLVVFVGVTSVRNVTRSVQASDWVNHTHAVILESDAVVSALWEGDAALKSYLLTGDPRDQVAYREAYSQMIEHVDVTRGLLKQDTESQPLVTELAELVRRRIDLARGLATLPRPLAPQDLTERLLAEAELTVPRQIVDRVARLRDRQKSLLQARDQAAFRQAQTTRWTVLSAIVINFTLLAATFWLVRDDSRARRRATEVLQDMNEQLEGRVRQRTQELAASNEALTVENLERDWTNQALEHQLRYSQLIINTIAEPILVVTQTLNVVRVNASVSSRTGIAEKHLIGSSAAQFLAGAEGEADAGLGPISAALRYERELHGMPARMRLANGQWVAVTVSAYPVRDADKVVGAVLTVRTAPNLV